MTMRVWRSCLGARCYKFVQQSERCKEYAVAMIILRRTTSLLHSCESCLCISSFDTLCCLVLWNLLLLGHTVQQQYMYCFFRFYQFSLALGLLHVHMLHACNDLAVCVLWCMLCMQAIRADHGSTDEGQDYAATADQSTHLPSTYSDPI